MSRQTFFKYVCFLSFLELGMNAASRRGRNKSGVHQGNENLDSSKCPPKNKQNAHSRSERLFPCYLTFTFGKILFNGTFFSNGQVFSSAGSY